MTRILVVWEDTYHDALDLFVRRGFSSRALEFAVRPEVLFHTSRGQTKFEHYVRQTWCNIRAKGLPSSPGRIDHLVCVADGDRLHEGCSAVSPAPRVGEQVHRWHADAEIQWETHLRSMRDPSVPESTIHCRILRWCKESVVLAGYDRMPSKEMLGIDINSPETKRILADCDPRPLETPDEVFTDIFRRPLTCLRKIQAGRRPIEKNAPEVDDALRALARSELDLIFKRVPDLRRLVELLEKLGNGQGRAPAAQSHDIVSTAPQQTSGRRKAKKKR